MTIDRLPHRLRRSLGRIAAGLLVALVAITAPLHAQAVGRIAIERFRLQNGLDVVLAPDRTVQVVSVDVWYGAGSRDEPPGKAGLARLFERLMFAGSANAPRGSYAEIVERVGGTATAAVDEETARFGNSLPSNRLGLALWLEADRMRSLFITDTSVAQARLAILEDLSRQVSDEPYQAAILDAVSHVYDSTTCLGYSHPTIGRVPSIASLNTADAAGYFRERYVPANARLVVAGDFDPADARRQIEQYFGAIPGGTAPPATTCVPGPAAATPRTRELTENRASRAAVGLFYQLPAHDHADMPALELLGVVLSQGSNARLSSRLVADLQVASTAQGGILGDRRGPGVFVLFAIGTPAVKADSLTALLQAQAGWATGDELTEADLTRARNIYLATAVTARERTGDIAELVHHAATFHGDPASINTEVDRVMAVSLADLKRVAAAWLAGRPALTLVIAPGAGS